MLFTDTLQDVYKDFWKDKHRFDNNDYPKDSKFYDESNKKDIGKFKNEAAGQIITEFVGLRSKMFSYWSKILVKTKATKAIKRIVMMWSIYENNSYIWTAVVDQSEEWSSQ